MIPGKTTEQRTQTVPVYEVTRTGLDEAQARKLVKAFGIPADEIILRDGVVSYIDRSGFLSPATEVRDPVMDDKTALRKTGEAFASAGLRLENAKPIAGSTQFSASFVDAGRAGTTVSHELQTQVSHEFSDGKGHPLIGPGAQVQVTYNGAGTVVQLHHATREWPRGPQRCVVGQAGGTGLSRMPSAASFGHFPTRCA